MTMLGGRQQQQHRTSKTCFNYYCQRSSFSRPGPPIWSNSRKEADNHIGKTCAVSFWCMPQEMVTGRLWPVCLWRATNDASHRRFLSASKAVWWLVQAALCRWWCCLVAHQLWRPIEDALDNNNSATPDLPICRTSPPFDKFQFILLGDRGTCIWTTCLRLLSESRMSSSHNCFLWLSSPTS